MFIHSLVSLSEIDLYVCGCVRETVSLCRLHVVAELCMAAIGSKLFCAVTTERRVLWLKYTHGTLHCYLERY